MNDSLEFGIKNKVAIFAEGGDLVKDIGNGRATSILI